MLCKPPDSKDVPTTSLVAEAWSVGRRRMQQPLPPYSTCVQCSLNGSEHVLCSNCMQSQQARMHAFTSSHRGISVGCVAGDRQSTLQVASTHLAVGGRTPSRAGLLLLNDRIQDTFSKLEWLSIDPRDTAVDKAKHQIYSDQTIRQNEGYTARPTGSVYEAWSGSLSLSDEVCELPKTTLMIRNIPQAYTAETLLQEWPNTASYNLFYLPCSWRLKQNLMYAFIDFTTAEAAVEFKNYWQKRRLASYSCQKPLNIGFADVQGRDENLRQLKKKRLLHTKNHMSQPLVFRNGERMPLEMALAELELGDSSYRVQRLKL